MDNSYIDLIMSRATIRQYLDKDVPDEVLLKLARAARAGTVHGEMYASCIPGISEERGPIAAHGSLHRRRPRLCVVSAWTFASSRSSSPTRGAEQGQRHPDAVPGIQDVSYAAMNFVMAAEANGARHLLLWRRTHDRAFPQRDVQAGPKECTQLSDWWSAIPPRSRVPARGFPTSCVLPTRSTTTLAKTRLRPPWKSWTPGLIREGYYVNLGAKIPAPEAGEDKGRVRQVRLERAYLQEVTPGRTHPIAEGTAGSEGHQDIEKVRILEARRLYWRDIRR